MRVIKVTANGPEELSLNPPKFISTNVHEHNLRVQTPIQFAAGTVTKSSFTTLVGMHIRRPIFHFVYKDPYLFYSPTPFSIILQDIYGAGDYLKYHVIAGANDPQTLVVRTNIIDVCHENSNDQLQLFSCTLKDVCEQDTALLKTITTICPEAKASSKVLIFSDKHPMVRKAVMKRFRFEPEFRSLLYVGNITRYAPKSIDKLPLGYITTQIRIPFDISGLPTIISARIPLAYADYILIQPTEQLRLTNKNDVDAVIDNPIIVNINKMFVYVRRQSQWASYHAIYVLTDANDYIKYIIIAKLRFGTHYELVYKAKQYRLPITTFWDITIDKRDYTNILVELKL